MEQSKPTSAGEKLRLILLDDEAGVVSEQIFGRDCTEGFNAIEDSDLEVSALRDPDIFLEQLSRSEVVADALLLDLDFTKLPGGRSGLEWTDPPASPKTWWGLDVLRTVKRIDPDFPVVILTGVADPSLTFSAGQFGADDFISKTLLIANNLAVLELQARVAQAISRCKRRSVYDHEHLVVADQFAETYDVEECSKCATVAYYHFENEWICSIVERLIKEIALPQGRRLSVLDLGCGTGRIEACLSDHRYRGYIDIAAVDFSGQMLRGAFTKLASRSDVCQTTFGRRIAAPAGNDRLNVALFRATAEHLETFRHRYEGGFDLAVLGFGFLSYVRYGQVLPAAVQSEAKTGVVPLLSEDGVLLFSVYNEESAIYERLGGQPSAEDLPIAAIMELDSGRLKVGEGRYFECEAFTMARMSRLLSQAGFRADPREFATFPTLHLTLDNSRSSTFELDQAFTGGRFSPDLFEHDKQLSRLFVNRGHYIVGEATKAKAARRE